MSDEELWAFIEETECQATAGNTAIEDAAYLQQETSQEQWRTLWIGLVLPPILWLSLVALISLVMVSWCASQGWYHPTSGASTLVVSPSPAHP
jgi:hypothetical protein